MNKKMVCIDANSFKTVEVGTIILTVIVLGMLLLSACKVDDSTSSDKSTVPGAPTNVTVTNTGTPGAGQVTENGRIPPTRARQPMEQQLTQ